VCLSARFETESQEERAIPASSQPEIKHDKALARVMTAVLKDDTELFKQFMDNESFPRRLTDGILDDVRCLTLQ
jgi:type I restriction enzyme R subunit